MISLMLGATLAFDRWAFADNVVPIHFVQPKIPLLMVPVKVNGQGPFDFMLDTGNGFAPYISPDLARKLDVKPRAQLDGEFAIGLPRGISIGEVDDIQVGPVSTGKLRVGVANGLTKLAIDLDARVDGNLGYTVLKDYCVTFDFRHGTLTFSKDEFAGESVPIQVGRWRPFPVVEVKVNGKPLHFMLDTGSSNCSISARAAHDLNLRLGLETNFNGNPNATGHQVTLGEVTIGNWTQHQVVASTADFMDDMSYGTNTSIDGLLGHNFWGKYKLTIDYPHKKLALQ